MEPALGEDRLSAALQRSRVVQKPLGAGPREGSVIMVEPIDAAEIDR
jgi:hypothetical protein